MDPDVTLQYIRDLIGQVDGTEGGTELEDLVRHIRNLDNWLSTGGFLPQDWGKDFPT